MNSSLTQTTEIKTLLDKVAGDAGTQGDPRLKRILRRIVADLFATIEEFDVTPEEFWGAIAFLQRAAPEFGLIAPGLGFDHFLDLRMDRVDREKGQSGGTPRTIEGPLYVPGAPQCKGWARLDDGTESGETLMMHGTVLDHRQRPIPGAIVDVWLANTHGGYSHFDPSQVPFNNRRRIETDAGGHYKFHCLLPSGYGVPPGGSTEQLLTAVGRHGKRPAHIHFFVSADGFRHLTTQINIDGDPLLHDDFAHATREGLIPPIVRQSDASALEREGLIGPFLEIAFDFVLLDAVDPTQSKLPVRPRVDVRA